MKNCGQWQQMSLLTRTRGGYRPGAGRKKTGRAGVPHRQRPELQRRHPAHVTLKLRIDAPKLRRRDSFAVLRRVLAEACDREDFRVVHFGIQNRHIHLLCEADDKKALARGIQSLEIRIAKRINRRFGRKGQVFADRYHARDLRTPTEVRNAIIYVLQNVRHHATDARRLGGDWLDLYSSAPYFGGWRRRIPRPLIGGPPEPLVATPRTWLLREGWMKAGSIDFADVPAG